MQPWYTSHVSALRSYVQSGQKMSRYVDARRRFVTLLFEHKPKVSWLISFFKKRKNCISMFCLFVTFHYLISLPTSTPTRAGPLNLAHHFPKFIKNDRMHVHTWLHLPWCGYHGYQFFLTIFRRFCVAWFLCTVWCTIQCIAGLKTCQMSITELELTVLSQVIKCSGLITSKLTAFEKELTKVILCHKG